MKLDGRKLAEEIRKNLKTQVSQLKEKSVTPHLAVVLIGNNPNSLIYVGQKKIQAEKVGVTFSLHQYSPKTPYAEIVAKIKHLAADPTIHGLIVQRPIPPPFSNELTNLVPPEKDVDGFLPNSPFDPPVALAVIKCLQSIYSSNNNLTPEFLDWLLLKKIVILGRGETAGKPIAHLLANYKIPFTVIHSQTANTGELLRTADIVVAAVGKPGVIDTNKLKQGVILIGIGLQSQNGRLVGDYNDNEVDKIARFYTPTPGGTGPVNVASLIENVVKAANNIKA